jgi:hypothetical protein
MDNDMVRITINIPKLQWHLIRQRFMSLLAKVRIGAIK